MSPSALLDALIVGAGPAGCSAASWAAQMGLKVAVLEHAQAPCASLAALGFEQDWVLGHPAAPLSSVGRQLADHAGRLPGIAWHLGADITAAQRDAGAWRLSLADGTALAARALVLATGTRPVRPAAFFAPGLPTLDAVSLTTQRASLPAGAVLLLGGGDNALENAAFLARRGHPVTLWTRGDWRGQPHLVEALEALPGIVQRRHVAPPTALSPLPGGGVEVESNAFGRERFAHVAVLYGYEPEPAPWAWLNAAPAAGGERHPPLKPGQANEVQGVFVAGDASGRWHPCVQTALADGVVVAQQLAAWLQPAGERAPLARRAPPATLNSQVLQLPGLRFGANLGVLAHERDGPQPIQVDAEINLGEQPALARDADLGHVLDYRKVRQIIIDECTAEHTDLLESLLAKLCVRLMGLPGVLGVRIRVAKLEIFEDCEVAIQTEAGLW
jgi:dihydroneopterin aldolase